MADFPGSRNGRYDYESAEHYTGAAWIDGLPIYRQVITIAGGNNSSSSGAVSGLSNSNRSTIVRVAFAAQGVVGGAIILQPEGITLADATGVVTVLHSGVDFTGITLHVIVEYTRVQP